MHAISPYAAELADAKLEALRILREALFEADSPAEKRRCAVAILRIREPDAPPAPEAHESLPALDDEAPSELNTPASPPAVPHLPPSTEPPLAPHLADQLRALLRADRQTVINTLARAPQELIDAMTPANLRAIAGRPP